MNNNLLYVCSPYRGEIRRNKEYARELTKAALNSGFAPVTVHLYMTEVLDEEKPEEGSRAGHIDAVQLYFDRHKIRLFRGNEGGNHAGNIKRADYAV